jgi:hypothetical protein
MHWLPLLIVVEQRHRSIYHKCTHPWLHMHSLRLQQESGHSAICRIVQGNLHLLSRHSRCSDVPSRRPMSWPCLDLAKVHIDIEWLCIR